MTAAEYTRCPLAHADGSLSTGLETDAAGVVHIDRGLFLDPKNPVQSVEFGVGEEEGERLGGKIAAPRDLDEVTVVRLEKAPPRPAYLDGL